VVVDESRAKLVAEAVRSSDLSVALAAVEVAAGGVAERRRMALRQGERAEGVVVLSAKLDLGHARERRLRQPVLDHLAGRHERRGVHREHAYALERDRASQDAGGTVREVVHVGATMHEPDQIVAQTRG
jgi:hypothetical protein